MLNNLWLQTIRNSQYSQLIDFRSTCAHDSQQTHQTSEAKPTAGGAQLLGSDQSSVIWVDSDQQTIIKASLRCVSHNVAVIARDCTAF